MTASRTIARELAAYLAYPAGAPAPADAARVAEELAGLALTLHTEVDELRGDVAELGRRVRELELAVLADPALGSRRAPTVEEELAAELEARAESTLAELRGRLGRWWR